MALLLDTNILVDFLRDRDDAVRLLDAQTELPGISVASIVELYAGARSRQQEERIEQLLTQAKKFPLTEAIAKRAGAFVRVYRPSHAVEPVDAIIAATAEHHGLA